MSDQPEVEAAVRAAKDFVDRAMAYGFSRADAWGLCKRLILNESDRIARERRSRFKVVQQ